MHGKAARGAVTEAGAKGMKAGLFSHETRE